MINKIGNYFEGIKSKLVKEKPYKARFLPVQVKIGNDIYKNELFGVRNKKFGDKKELSDYLQKISAGKQTMLNISRQKTAEYYPVIIEHRSPYEVVVGLNVLPKQESVEYKLIDNK